MYSTDVPRDGATRVPPESSQAAWLLSNTADHKLCLAPDEPTPKAPAGAGTHKGFRRLARASWRHG